VLVFKTPVSVNAYSSFCYGSIESMVSYQDGNIFYFCFPALFKTGKFSTDCNLLVNRLCQNG